MSSPSPAQPAAPEEKKETRPWNPEEKQLFYKGFNKYYKKFQQISEMIPSRSFTQVRQLYYRETKKIQNLLGEAQSLVDWSDREHVLCVFNSYASIIKDRNDAAKVMKSKKYIDRLKHSLERINKRKELSKLKEKEKEEAFARSLPKTSPHPVFPSDAKGQPSLPHSLKPANTMVVRLIPASEAMSNALKSYRYCPLLE
ncbi:hypothetical protein WA577_004461, partial [Blastocystis sp. JDR]